MRGNVSPAPVQPLSSALACAYPALPPAAVVPSVTLFEYHAVRVLMSVLFTPAAPTRIRTSPGPGAGTGISSRYSNCSNPPCPLSSTPRMRVAVVIAASPSGARRSEDDDIAQGFAPVDRGDGLVDPLQGIARGDQLVEFQASLLVEIDDHGNVETRAGGAHLRPQHLLAVIGEVARIERRGHAGRRHPDEHQGTAAPHQLESDRKSTRLNSSH